MAEDLTRRVRPRYRIVAAVVSAMLASLYSDGTIPRLDLPLVDELLGYQWLVLPLTWFMVAGACNAMNLIDGAHGLAGGTALLMFGGIALAAAWGGDEATLVVAHAMIGALNGFFVWNYPCGRVFLGEAGAYFIGYVYAELSRQVVARNGNLSAWFVIVLAACPIVETLYSMHRRAALRSAPLMAPDRIAPALARLSADRAAARAPKRRRRSRCQRARRSRLWVHGLMCFSLAALFYDKTPVLWASFVVYAVFYVSRYRTLVRFADRRARRGALPPATEVVERSPDAS